MTFKTPAKRQAEEEQNCAIQIRSDRVDRATAKQDQRARRESFDDPSAAAAAVRPAAAQKSFLSALHADTAALRAGNLEQAARLAAGEDLRCSSRESSSTPDEEL